ncbi:MAG: WYL domain-containing protein [Tenericutes bacterium]|nr:WYL domain-containing protein [Mycoplasmatota bacterium]
MSKREAIARYSLIINKLRRRPASFEEILDYLKAESEIQSYNYVVSKRTFQRDLNDIRSLYGIEITNDKRNNVYYLNQQEGTVINERILEAYDTFNALSLNDRIAEHIQFEKRSALGTEHLFGLLHAIKNSVQIHFSYQSFTDNSKPSTRSVEPYLLKEYKGRWYLVAVDNKDKHIKSFALDRFSDLEITKSTFTKIRASEVEHYYENSFGIVGPNLKTSPEEIVLKFTPHQGKYIKSLPLHHSQIILEDDEQSLVIRLKLHITHDFVMEILSHGANVKVVSPVSLVNEMKRFYQEALEQYHL